MADDALRPMLVAELALVESTIRDLGYDTRLDPDAEPVPALAADLGDDGSGGHPALMVTLHQADLFADQAELHVDVLLPFDVDPDRREDVATAIDIVNRSTSVGTYQLGGATIGLHHAVTVDSGSSLPDDVVQDAVRAVVDEHERFSDYLEGVADDEISVLVLADLIAADGDGA